MTGSFILLVASYPDSRDRGFLSPYRLTMRLPNSPAAILIGLDNATVPLANLTGVNDVGNFDGTLSAGNWRVKVVDSVRKQTGTMNNWTLTIEY